MADTREKYTSVRRDRGEENLDIINKAKWRTHFIDIRQY